jgi:hypothetical protein
MYVNTVESDATMNMFCMPQFLVELTAYVALSYVSELPARNILYPAQFIIKKLLPKHPVIPISIFQIISENISN